MHARLHRDDPLHETLIFAASSSGVSPGVTRAELTINSLSSEPKLSGSWGLLADTGVDTFTTSELLTEVGDHAS